MARGIGGPALNPSGIDTDESVRYRSLRPPRLIQLQSYALAVLSVGIALGMSLLLQHFHFRVPAVPLLLFAVAISSWYGGTGPAVLAVAVSIISLYWYFIEPVPTIYIYSSEIPFFLAFVGFAALLSGFGVVRRRAEKDLREQADLLNLTHDTVFVMDMEGVIKYWNRGAEEQYGWSAQQTMGKVVHELLKTVFPSPLHEIEAEVTRTGRWEGELRHIKKDGTQVVVASRWALQRNRRGVPVAILETNNDVTERKLAEEALRRSEAYLTEAQRLTHTGSWALDAATREYTYWSEEMFRIFGVDPRGGIPIREAMAQRIHPEDVSRAIAGFEKSLREKVDTCDEYRFVLSDGTVRHIQSTRHPILNDAGDVIQLVGTFVDITERKRADEALRQSEAYLAESEKLSNTGSWSLDPAGGRYLYVSKQDYRIWGFDPRDGLPTREAVCQRIHPDDRDKWKQNFENSLREKADGSDEYRIVLPDGKLKHIHTIRHAVLNSAGDLVKLVGTTVDVTERKHAEEALRRTAAYLAEAQKLTHTGSWALDGTGQQVYWSEEVFRIWGFDPQHGLPKHDQTVQRIHLEDLEKYWEYWQAAYSQIREKIGLGLEFRIVLPDGTVKHLRGVAHPILNEKGDVVEVVGATVDVTERKRADEQRDKLRELEADLAHINRVSMMGELTASVAHEVNQPLSGVVSNGSACLRWLAAEVPNLDEAREAARRVVRDGKRAGEIIARIRALTKRAATPIEKLDLNEAVREVLPLVADQAKQNSVIVGTRFADDLSPVSGDRVQLQQVVLNLVINAIEAMPSVGERPRELLVTTRNIDPDQVELTVEDSGIGLNPDKMEKIFEPFYTTKPGGMGMGLSICRSILQAHGGRLWATTKDGQPGTIFHFTLPKYQEEELNARVAGV